MVFSFNEGKYLIWLIDGLRSGVSLALSPLYTGVISEPSPAIPCRPSRVREYTPRDYWQATATLVEAPFQDASLFPGPCAVLGCRAVIPHLVSRCGRTVVHSHCVSIHLNLSHTLVVLNTSRLV